MKTFTTEAQRALLVVAMLMVMAWAPVSAWTNTDGHGQTRTGTDLMAEMTEPLYVIERKDLAGVPWSGTLRPDAMLVSTAGEGESLIPPVEKDEAGRIDWLAVVAGAVGLVWSFFRGTSIYRDRRYQQGLDLIAGQVTQTYHEYVRAIKAARQDGRLTPEEKKTAMSMTLNNLRSHALEMGYDLYKAFHCDEVIKAKVEEAISSAKAKAKAQETRQ